MPKARKTARRSTGSKVRKSHGSKARQSHVQISKASKVTRASTPTAKAGKIGVKKIGHAAIGHSTPLRGRNNKFITRWLPWFRSFGSGFMRAKK